ncbi:MAG: hydroxymethylbilane synthase [Deltaproteobacteria bacterium]|nr:hydroxymethylbilane synthase [Deltaproteobacteria bacterium]
MKLRIGTRGSKLALWQAEHVKARLMAEAGASEVELVVIKTTGDRVQDVALSEVGGKGLFTKEIEEALLAGTIDLAVHSMKDVPSVLPEGCALAAVPERADPRDAWVAPAGSAASWADLADGAIVGTSSLRRARQLALFAPGLATIPLRGNVDTRLRKVDEGDGGLAAIVLACAGLGRLGLGHRITAPIPTELMLPAVGQGALAIETRADDARVRDIVNQLDHPATRYATDAERAFLGRLEGSCRIPIAGHATLDGDEIVLRGELFATDDSGRRASGDMRGALADARSIGVALADALRAQARGFLA